MYNVEESPLRIKSCDFAIRVSNMVDYLRANSTKNVGTILSQILRSGTSIMANISESQYAQSRADFISKLHIALKEANETNTWLLLLRKKDCLTIKQHESMSHDCNELIAMLVSSIKTSKKNDVSNSMAETD